MLSLRPSFGITDDLGLWDLQGHFSLDRIAAYFAAMLAVGTRLVCKAVPPNVEPREERRGILAARTPCTSRKKEFSRSRFSPRGKINVSFCKALDPTRRKSEKANLRFLL